MMRLLLQNCKYQLFAGAQGLFCECLQVISIFKSVVKFQVGFAVIIMLIIRDKPFVAVLVATIIAACFIQGSSQPFTAFEMDTMLQDIDSYFFSGANSQFKMEIRKFLRAAFHDCMGGCDGSINLAKTDNRGLQRFVREVSTAYSFSIKATSPHSSIFSRMSRADFWVLCEQRALAWGIKNGFQTISFSGANFAYGRLAAALPDNSPTETALPNAAGNWSDMLADFQVGNPYINQQDIVTLLGLHGSGSAEISNSGFQGPWGPSSDKNVVNNHFYVGLLSYGFPRGNLSQILAANSNFGSGPINPTTTSPPPPTNLIEWVRSGGQTIAAMMLPIDMQIYFSFNTNATGGESDGIYCSQGNNSTLFDCTISNSGATQYLPLAKNAPLAFSYAQNNAKYLAALVPAFLRMVSNAPSVSLTQFSATWGCVNQQPTCLGDIFFAGCPQPPISC